MLNLNIADHLISQFLFCPDKDIKELPSDFGLKYEEVEIDLPGKNKLHGWYVFANKETNKNIIYLHGTKGNVSLYLGGIEQLHKVGANIFIFDYAGFGKSTGKSLIQNTIDNALSAYDYLVYKRQIKSDDISLFGYSYGGAVALELALKRKVRALLLECTFSSLKKIAASKYSFASALIPGNVLNSLENIRKINVPLTVAYAENDQIIPATHSLELFDQANSPKSIFKIENAEHHNIFKFVKPEYISVIKEVLVD